MEQKNNWQNLNSKRWFCVVALYIMFFYLIIKGSWFGFPEKSEAIIWSYISGSFTQIILWVTGIFIGGETWRHIANAKKK